MNKLVAELRDWVEPYKTDGLDGLLLRAADEIESLSRALELAHGIAISDRNRPEPCLRPAADSSPAPDSVTGTYRPQGETHCPTPLDEAAIVSDPSQNRISMRFANHSQYEAALEYLSLST